MRPFDLPTLNPWAAALGIAIVLALLLSGLPSIAPASAIVLPGRSDPGSLPGSVIVAPAFVPIGGIEIAGPMPVGASIAVAVGLGSPELGSLPSEIALQYTPGSPDYHHYLTPSEIADRYGAPVGEYRSAAAYFESFGLQVTTSPDRMLLFVHGAPGPLGEAFGTSFLEYRDGPTLFYSHPTPARLPGGLPWSGVVGLGNETKIQPDISPASAPTIPLSVSPAASGCPSSSWATPCLAHAAYNLTSLLTSGDNGTGERVGIVDVYDGGEPQNQLASDFASFTQTFTLPGGSVAFVYPIPSGGNMNSTFTGWAAEEALDIEWTRAMAPGAVIDMTFAPNTNTGLYQAVDWLVSHDAVNVITMSWGENDVGVYNAFSGVCRIQCNASSDGSYETLHPVLEAAAAEGITLFSASGDCGTADGTNGVSTNYPASDPYVTGVGATDLTFGTGGAYGGETAWAGNSSGSSSPGCQNQGGSGGGYAPFSRPYWQNATGVPSSPDLRGVPDVSILGGSPGAEIVIQSSVTVEGGSSLSSPMWAGIAADADTYGGQQLGFLNPSLYDIARSPSGSTAFHDVTKGWNGYNATKGWDPVTGLGSPNALVLLPRLSGTPVPSPNGNVSLLAGPRFGNAPLAVRFHANASGGPGSTSFYDIAFGDGNATTTQSGNASYTFTAPGVYAATATAFDRLGNSSTSQALTIVVGGGGPLTVALNISNAHPGLGSAVTLSTNVTGGTGPYNFSYEFGDGTYLDGSNQSRVTHAYRAPGGTARSSWSPTRSPHRTAGSRRRSPSRSARRGTSPAPPPRPSRRTSRWPPPRSTFRGGSTS